MFKLVDDEPQEAVIKVIGVGGGGGNAVCHMLDSMLADVEFICANTDAQALKKQHGKANIHLQLGESITRGLGAGSNPEIGKQAAMEDRERIAESLKGSDMVFIAAGMGGGTGTGAAPIVAEIAKELGALTVAIVTKPFSFEGKRRMKIAESGLEDLKNHVDSLIIIPNEKLMPVLGADVSLLSAFSAANDVLLGAVQGISELITKDGLINVDFADVRTVMSEMGMAMMGTGSATGPNRAIEAAEKAIKSQLLEDVDLEGAQGVLVNISAGTDFTVGEYNSVGEVIGQFASNEAAVVIGTVIDENLSDELKVTVVATGISLKESTENHISNPVIEDKIENTESFDMKNVDIPAIIRKNKNNVTARSEAHTPSYAENNANNMDYLDIPAFLRRQTE